MSARGKAAHPQHSPQPGDARFRIVVRSRAVFVPCGRTKMRETQHGIPREHFPSGGHRQAVGRLTTVPPTAIAKVNVAIWPGSCQPGHNFTLLCPKETIGLQSGRALANLATCFFRTFLLFLESCNSAGLLPARPPPTTVMLYTNVLLQSGRALASPATPSAMGSLMTPTAPSPRANRFQHQARTVVSPLLSGSRRRARSGVRVAYLRPHRQGFAPEGSLSSLHAIDRLDPLRVITGARFALAWLST